VRPPPGTGSAQRSPKLIVCGLLLTLVVPSVLLN
jgi:hypothetical protein